MRTRASSTRSSRVSPVLPCVRSARARSTYRRLHVLLRREGWKVNAKRVYRLYKLEGLGVRTKKRKKRGSYLRVVPSPPTAPTNAGAWTSSRTA